MTQEPKKDTAGIRDESFITRKAMPNIEEGRVFAGLLNEASEGFFKSMLGAKTEEIIADAFVKSNNEYSFENTRVLEYKGKIAGMVSGYTKEEKERFTKNILLQYKGGAKPRIMLFSLTGKLLSRFLGPSGKKDYYLQAIAVVNEMRGKGLGQSLLKSSAEIALQKGSKTLSLDVSAKNTTAIKSYHKFGMQTHSFWPDFLKIPPVFTRMVKEL